MSLDLYLGGDDDLASMGLSFQKPASVKSRTHTCKKQNCGQQFPSYRLLKVHRPPTPTIPVSPSLVPQTHHQTHHHKPPTMTTTTTTMTANPPPQTPPTTPPPPSHDDHPIIPPLDLASLPSSPSSSILSPPLSPLSPSTIYPLTTPTTPSTNLTTNLTQTLIHLLTSHPPLPTLHRAAYTTLGPVRFQRNLGRLISHYARDLRTSASTPAQRQTATLVSRSARAVASSITDSLTSGQQAMGFSPRGKRAILLATLLQRGHDDIPCVEDDDTRECDDGGGGGEEEDGELDTDFLLSSPAFPALSDAYRAWLTTTAPPPRSVESSSPVIDVEARRARVAMALLSGSDVEVDRIPSVTEYDGCGIWLGDRASRPTSPPPPMTPTSSRRENHRVVTRQRQAWQWWKSQWTVAAVVSLIGIVLGFAACWTLSSLTGVALGTVLTVVGEWMGAGLAGAVVVYVARHHHRYLVVEGDEDEVGECEE